MNVIPYSSKLMAENKNYMTSSDGSEEEAGDPTVKFL